MQIAAGEIYAGDLSLRGSVSEPWASQFRLNLLVTLERSLRGLPAQDL